MHASAPQLWMCIPPCRVHESGFKLVTGEYEMYFMYSRNIRVEGDGLAFKELNLLLALVLEPVLWALLLAILSFSNLADSPEHDAQNSPSSHKPRTLTLLCQKLFLCLFPDTSGGRCDAGGEGRRRRGVG